MKKIILLIFVYYSPGNFASAQIDHGGFGYFFMGSVYNLNPQLQNKLSPQNVVGNVRLNTSVFDYGGAGYAIRPNGFVLGGSGYNYFISSDAQNGNVRLNMSCGFFNIGHLVLNRRKWIGFPYFGFGAFGTGFRITNTSSDRVLMLGSDIISPGQRERYATGGFAFDAGFGLKHFRKDKEKKGMIGVDAGFSFFPSFFRWKNLGTGSQNNLPGMPFAMAGYARLTLGLGVLHRQEKVK